MPHQYGKICLSINKQRFTKLDQDLNNTQSAPDTANPQGVGTSNGASNASDFQETAPQDTLQNQSTSLGVDGVQANNSTQSVTDGLSPFWWAAIAFGVVFVCSYLAIRFFDKEAKAPARVASRPAAKKTAKKPVAKKKPATRKSTKKTTKKRR